MTRGEVFLFPLAGGGREIAGGSVKIASKLAEDAGLEGILVECSALPDSGPALGGTPFSLTLSRVEITGVRFPGPRQRARPRRRWRGATPRHLVVHRIRRCGGRRHLGFIMEDSPGIGHRR